MGYFPNGTSGADYIAEYCDNCINWRDNGSGSEGCFIMDLHFLWNYEACNGKAEDKDSSKRAKFDALEHFIPHTENGLGCAECRMYVPKQGALVTIDKTEALKEWESIYGRRTE